DYLEDGVPMLVLETALPAKFAETIVEAIGVEPPVPAHLSGLSELPQRVVNLPCDAERVREYIREHAPLPASEAPWSGRPRADIRPRPGCIGWWGARRAVRMADRPVTEQWGRGLALGHVIGERGGRIPDRSAAWRVRDSARSADVVAPVRVDRLSGRNDHVFGILRGDGRDADAWGLCVGWRLCGGECVG